MAVESPKPSGHLSRREFFTLAGATAVTVALTRPNELTASPLPEWLSGKYDSGFRDTFASLEARNNRLQNELGIDDFFEIPKTGTEITQTVKRAMELPLQNHTRWFMERSAVLACAKMATDNQPQGLALAENNISGLAEQYARNGLLEIIWAYRQTGLIKHLPPLSESEIGWAREYKTDPRILAFCHDAQKPLLEIIKDPQKLPDIGTLIGIMTLETTYDLHYEGQREALANIGEYSALTQLRRFAPEAVPSFTKLTEWMSNNTGFPFNFQEGINIPGSPMGAIGPQIMPFNLVFDGDFAVLNPFHPLGAVTQTGLFLSQNGYNAEQIRTLPEILMKWNQDEKQINRILGIRTDYLRTLQRSGSSRGQTPF